MQMPLPNTDLAIPPEASATLPRVRRVYVNRSLRLDQIEMVGFDMDYTLAIYEQEHMDRLSIEATVRKLVERGYPEALLKMPYRTDFPVRGLLIDKKLGNILKMDRYRYVKKAYHGMRALTRDERRSLYHSKRVRIGGNRYHWVDTLYALSEVSVFAAVVDEMEREGAAIDYDKLFGDVRACIDIAHQDGSILDVVLSDLPKYIERDPLLGAMFHKLRSAGKKLFLLTNSRAAYTDTMMTYLVGGALPEYPSWRNYFDIIITASRKPSFFMEQSPLLEVLDDGTTRPATNGFERGKVYQGGNIDDFERAVDTSSDRILYVGDHIYGDVLRAKKESAWRTVMIIQEMDGEIAAIEKTEASVERMDAIDDARDRLENELRVRQGRFKELSRTVDQLHERAAAPGDPVVSDIEAARLREKRAIDRVRGRLRALDAEYIELEDLVDADFHTFWGSLFKCGPEVSSFGDQIEKYACLYTDRASNLFHYSPMHYFRSPRDRMPHEL